MPLISIIMPCYNAEDFLEKSIRSILGQTINDWELIIVNDGSTDSSEKIALSFVDKDQRISVITKRNGGYVSARLEGYKYISEETKYLIFYDADDKLDPAMLEILVTEMEKYSVVGAVYCNHQFIDKHDVISNLKANMPRLIPTRFWLTELPETVKETPFISIFCWTKMIEPMTLLRRKAYEQTGGWDPQFGLGKGNIGEGVYLFSEIALTWKVHYINTPLYYYRKHGNQMTAVPMTKMRQQANIVINKWKERLNQPNEWNDKIKAAILFFNYRVAAYRRLHSLKHLARYKPVKALYNVILFLKDYLLSVPLVFSYKKLR